MTTRDFLNGVGRNIVFENKKIYNRRLKNGKEFNFFKRGNV